jgi:hypothetical protein
MSKHLPDWARDIFLERIYNTNWFSWRNIDLLNMGDSCEDLKDNSDGIRGQLVAEYLGWTE